MSDLGGVDEDERRGRLARAGTWMVGLWVDRDQPYGVLARSFRSQRQYDALVASLDRPFIGGLIVRKGEEGGTPRVLAHVPEAPRWATSPRWRPTFGRPPHAAPVLILRKPVDPIDNGVDYYPSFDALVEERASAFVDDPDADELTVSSLGGDPVRLVYGNEDPPRLVGIEHLSRRAIIMAITEEVSSMMARYRRSSFGRRIA